MSLPPEISKQNFEVFPRAHAQKFSGARQHDDKKNLSKNFVATTKSNKPQFFHIFCFLLLFVAATKNVAKMLPNTKQTFFV